MDRTLVLIGRAHQGDKAARDLLFEENTGLIYEISPFPGGNPGDPGPLRNE